MGSRSMAIKFSFYNSHRNWNFMGTGICGLDPKQNHENLYPIKIKPFIVLRNYDIILGIQNPRDFVLPLSSICIWGIEIENFLSYHLTDRQHEHSVYYRASALLLTLRNTRGATVTGCVPVVSFSWKGLY